MAILEVENLNKYYSPKKAALNNLNLKVERGDFIALLGPNGAGKSTFINILAGLVNKTSGSIRVNGYDFDKQLRHVKMSLGIIPQEIHFDPFFTVYEALENYAGYYGVREPKKKIYELIEVLGLKEKANSKPRSLSGGMRRRLLIAKALVHNPPLVILDEPTAGVDIELREQLWDYLRQLNAEGTTIILTTHYLEDAERLCNTVAIINHGHIIISEAKHNILHLLSQKSMIVSFEENIEDTLMDVERFTIVRQSSNSINISFNKSEITAGEIITTLGGYGLKIIDISTTETKLEDIFRYLINQ